MASTSKRRLVQTVFRPDGGSDTFLKEIQRPVAAKSRLTASGRVVALPVHNASLKERNAALVGVKKRTPPKQKVQQKRVSTPKAVKHVKPHLEKETSGLPLVDRLNDVLLAQLRQRIVTNRQAAEALGVHPNYLSRVVASMQDKTPGPVRKFRMARSKLAKARNHTRIELAKAVHRGDITLAKACKQANCAERTMYRWMSKYANQKAKK